MKTIAEKFLAQYTDDTAVLRPLPPFPRSVMIEITNACNHACVFCANAYMKRPVRRMRGDLIGRVLREARALGAEDVAFYSTGEPFIHKHLEDLVAEAAGLGYGYIYLSTNGALATPDRLRAVIDAGLHSLKFSINAGSAATYHLIHGRDDWDAVMANLRFVADYRRTSGRRFNLGISYVVTNQNRAEVDAFRAAVGPLVDEIMFRECQTQMGQMDPAAALLSDHPGHIPHDGVCRMPFNRLHVTCEGYLTLCCIDYNNHLAVVDIGDRSLAEAWADPAFVAARQAHLDQRLDGTLCGKCWLGSAVPAAPLVPAFATPVDEAAQDAEIHRETVRRLAAAGLTPPSPAAAPAAGRGAGAPTGITPTGITIERSVERTGMVEKDEHR